MSTAIRFDNSYARELKGFYVPWEGAEVPEPRMVLFNRRLADALGLDVDALDSPQGAAFFTGAAAPEGAEPLAQVYAGHQFGGFSPQLGDGRALLVGEILDPGGRRWDLHLKGSGRTPFSRGGDGKAVLAPVLREYLIGEAMYALGIPTTRALAAATTGERIVRDGGPKPGAVLARIASSHLRIGTFQFFAARGQMDHVAQLVGYALRRHAPELANADDPALELLRLVRDRQAALVAQWMGVGFIHGVMNTDNTTISGETLDYGPCAFMDRYDPATVFSSIDRHGRYAYGNQPAIMQWNLARLAEAILPLIRAEDEAAGVQIATDEIEAFAPLYRAEWVRVMRAKLGLEGGDARLADDLFAAMSGEGVDFTRFFRALGRVMREGSAASGDLRVLFDHPEAIDGWLGRWSERVAAGGPGAAERADAMDRVNPVYVPRNHLVEAALQAAEAHGELGPLATLLEVLQDPYRERAGYEGFADPAPDDFGPYVTYCGT
ncbi:MAG: YdiU family protein [Gemmatimonadetes bacterium]|nr:YdiU family protein [Gemmatimonadota bacterium]NNK62243.1 YdiU family protein [Gemmatimonadota bacterium]